MSTEPAGIIAGYNYTYLFFAPIMSNLRILPINNTLSLTPYVRDKTVNEDSSRPQKHKLQFVMTLTRAGSACFIDEVWNQ